MREKTRIVLENLKNLQETFKRMEKSGKMTADERQKRLFLEEHMKKQIRECLEVEQQQMEIEKAAREKSLHQISYRRERQRREMNRLIEEAEYRIKVDEEAAERVRKDAEEEAVRKARQQMLEDRKRLEAQQEEEAERKKREKREKKKQKKNKNKNAQNESLDESLEQLAL